MHARHGRGRAKAAPPALFRAFVAFPLPSVAQGQAALQCVSWTPEPAAPIGRKNKVLALFFGRNE